MKKKILFTFLLLIVCATKNFAQGNLQFNQVIFYDFAANGTQAINIPSGKVWKIEWANNYNTSATGITLRNAAVQVLANINTTNIATNPVWLPSGFVGSFLNGSGTGRACISILEFNVIP